MKTKLVYAAGFVAITYPIYAKTPSFVGDLVGRDLVGVGPLGHIGVASAPDHRMRPTVVLEAMDFAPHIQENTIDNFKSRSKFWGSKGGLLSPKSIESYTVANRIVRQYYAGPEYTITWRWKEGKIDSNNKPISCGQFRCDTLVNYAYAFNKGYSLPTFNTAWTTPVAVYNYFPVDTDLLIPEQVVDTPIMVPNTMNTNISTINASNIEDIDDEYFYQILQNSTDISEDQIKYLWKLFTSKSIDKKVKLLFYDFIAFEVPSYLTEGIIKQAKNEHGELRHKLLVILQSIYQKRLEENEEENLQEIMNYFKEIQLQHLDKNDGGIVYRGLALLAPKYLDTRAANLTNMDRIHVDIFKLKSDRTHEIKYVQDIIDNLDRPDDSLVVTASYQYLTQLLMNTDLTFFSDKSKQLFKKHLDKNSMLRPNQTLLYTSAYLEFKAALNANKAEEIPALIESYMQSLAPDVQEAVFYGFTEFSKKPSIE